MGNSNSAGDEGGEWCGCWRTVESIRDTASELEWSVVDESVQLKPNGEWSATILVDTDMGWGQFSTRHDDDAVSFHPVWIGGFDDIVVDKEAFILEAEG